MGRIPLLPSPHVMRCAVISLPVICSLVLATASDADAPTARSFHFPEVQRAWDEGGEDRVKDWMRAMVKRTKKAGRRIPSTGKKPKCGSCHENLKQYPLSPNALEDLRILLESEAAAGVRAGGP